MRFALGFLAGVGAAWAALAIWQGVAPLGPIDPGDVPAVVPYDAKRHAGMYP